MSPLAIYLALAAAVFSGEADVSFIAGSGAFFV